MTAKKTFYGSPKLALAAIVATGMAASPLALGANFDLGMNTAAAQTLDNSDTGTKGEATTFVEGAAGATGNVYDSPYDILGTTADEMNNEVTQVQAGTAGGPIGEYKEALRSNNLDNAARVLALSSNRPITQYQVGALNDSLGVDTDLTVKEIADAAEKQQDKNNLTMPMLTEGNPPFDTANMSLDVHSREFRNYEAALRDDNLDAAAQSLAAATKRPITEDLVRDVNSRLGVETNLTITQIAQAASSEQDAN